MALSHRTTLNWPFWQVLNTVEFNWFAAPQHWQLALPRFLMGFGSGMVLLSMMGHASREPESEAKDPAIPPGRAILGRCPGHRRPGDLSARRAPDPLFLHGRPRLHPVGGAGRPPAATRQRAGRRTARRNPIARPKRSSSAGSTTRRTISSSPTSTAVSSSPPPRWRASVCSVGSSNGGPRIGTGARPVRQRTPARREVSPPPAIPPAPDPRTRSLRRGLANRSASRVGRIAIGPQRVAERTGGESVLTHSRI